MEEKDPARRRFLHFNIVLVTVAGVIFLYWLFCKISGLHFPCLFALLFHLYCPGCGCTRAAEALFRLDFAASLAANPSVLVGAALLLYYEIILFLRMRRGCGKAPACLPAVLFGIFFLVYAVLRNVLLVTLQFDPLGDHYMFWS